ncbi:hypothetical protein SAMN05216359_105337 [Roseateles sp. YR242]|uniref:hypothetical protein n=1 Tax=Roseateles sp. YR242 TaxID=1855305 RepID=UPI0008B5E146|nr:hypothetical protein [Roseateles sp. YR242]SEL13797.1 hypothetical protein SAMN05216359_105337 [Roseateles sp. YR242]
MTDHITKIRQAVSHVPPQAPWQTAENQDAFVYSLNAQGYNHFWAHVTGPWSSTAEKEAIGRHIAACNPEAIRSLLAALDEAQQERDGYRSQLAACREAAGIAPAGSPTEPLWIEAIGNPFAVADYVKAALEEARSKLRLYDWIRSRIPERKYRSAGGAYSEDGQTGDAVIVSQGDKNG